MHYFGEFIRNMSPYLLYKRQAELYPLCASEQFYLEQFYIKGQFPQSIIYLISTKVTYPIQSLTIPVLLMMTCFLGIAPMLDPLIYLY